MSTFETNRFISTRLHDLSAVVRETEQHFTAQGFDVKSETSAMGVFISLSKGGLFKAVLGMKTALNIDIKKAADGLTVEAGVGIFGQQLLPSVISMFIAWPVLLTQISGLVRQSKLDDEALQVVEQSIRRQESTGGSTAGGTLYCTNCGAPMPANTRFCGQCGAPLE